MFVPPLDESTAVVCTFVGCGGGMVAVAGGGRPGRWLVFDDVECDIVNAEASRMTANKYDDDDRCLSSRCLGI
jgi:hypothetical protein